MKCNLTSTGTENMHSSLPYTTELFSILDLEFVMFVEFFFTSLYNVHGVLMMCSYVSCGQCMR